jgi:hypothetical protein
MMAMQIIVPNYVCMQGLVLIDACVCYVFGAAATFRASNDNSTKELSSILYYTILTYYTIPYYTIHTLVLNSTKQYCTVLYNVHRNLS